MGVARGQKYKRRAFFLGKLTQLLKILKRFIFVHRHHHLSAHTHTHTHTNTNKHTHTRVFLNIQSLPYSQTQTLTF